MSVIFFASADTQSVPRTSRIIEPFCRWIYPAVTQEQLETVRWVVRKGAHMGVFAILSVLLLYALAAGRPPARRWIPYAWGLAVVFAISDEVHQLFVPGRNGCVRDVLIDAAGAAIGLAVCWVFLKWHKK